MIKSILAVGDSFTYGSELPDTVATPDTVLPVAYTQHSNLAWPSQLATRLGATVTNRGLPGGGNSRIFRVAIEETIKNSHDLVICAWTEPARLDITLQGQEFPVTINSAWHHEQFPWIREYFARHYDWRHTTQNWLSQLVALQQYFKSRQQQYMFVNVQSEWQWQDTLVIQKLHHYLDEIDEQYYPDWKQGLGMTHWMGDCAKGPGGHPLELGHKRIAERIYEHIISLGWA
jgi:hypothetical protein